MLGEAAGTAAAIAAKDAVPPRILDIKKLQRALLNNNVYLGNEDRLKQLSLEQGE
jgi:hypothetical protein